ncbi:hypothetical protein ACQEVG_14975 [Streptomyces sp. CA-135486]|uniref:hypothetical protein n=1 Tax=Streptomyces sp. CA-135486 TaxID=3240049 RepID=UPI003D8D1204
MAYLLARAAPRWAGALPSCLQDPPAPARPRDSPRAVVAPPEAFAEDKRPQGFLPARKPADSGR